jgi:hypothetical protein
MAASSKPATKEAHEMLSKTRTTIVALVAAFSFAGASLIPAVAHAMTKYEYVKEIEHHTQLSR